MLMDMTLRDFCALLASKEPAPGGGSAAALTGSLAAALGQMVVGLTAGKKAFKALDADTQGQVLGKGEALAELMGRLSELVELDTAAFNGYLAAIKRPNGTDEEKAARDAAIADASEAIIAIPLETCGKCLDVLEACLSVAEHGNKNAVSDVGTAANLAYAALESAALNVLINAGDGDAEKQEKCRFEAEKFSIIGKGYYEKVMGVVKSRLKPAADAPGEGAVR